MSRNDNGLFAKYLPDIAAYGKIIARGAEYMYESSERNIYGASKQG
jgi:hypothetical protein